ncbi:hypothetical protein T484DRAFT_1787107 [Baffinella frigidus]|nr:hypothetical protein T484DRAFT_1787107 [Cryptophyta sp. CCMP2293]
MAATPAILSFFEPEASWPPLHYGDSVALIPDGINGITAFSGANDGRPWVEVLADGATLPPNLRDCHFRLVPRGQ